MPKCNTAIPAIIGGLLLAFTTCAQDVTNAPKTEIETFEARTGTVIVKGLGQIGSVTTDAGVISVRCKESTDATSGQKQYGMAVVFDGNHHERAKAVVDEDEMDSLINGVNYLGKVTYTVTSLPSFEATYSTKSGLRLVAYSSKRQGGIQDFLQFGDSPRILLTSSQFAQLQALVSQAKSTLDSLKGQ
jgi:hypothetical protein